MRRPSGFVRRITPALALALLLAVAGCGSDDNSSPEVPDGAVAIVEGVDDGAVTDAEYERALDQAGARLDLDEAPEPDSPEGRQASDEAMQGLLLQRWAEGEAADRDIEITDEDVDEERAAAQESFRNQKEFARVVRESRFCTEEEIESDVPPQECADVTMQIRLLALQRALSDSFAADAGGPDAAQEELSQIQDDFIAKWTARTGCNAEVEMQFCSGFEAPEPEVPPTDATLPPGAEGP